MTTENLTAAPEHSGSNASSLVVFRHLIDDTQAQLSYWMNQPESDERTTNMNNYSKNLIEQQSHYDRVIKQSEERGDDLKSDIEKVLDWLSDIIRIAGGLIDEKTKAFIVALINAARKLLEILK